jgi:hypothetical protein
MTLKVHDSLQTKRCGDRACFSVRRTQINESLIALFIGAGTGWIPAAVASGVTRIIIAIAVGLLTVLAMYRAFRIRIEVSHEGLKILNYWRTFRVRWQEVQDVAIGAIAQGMLPQSALALKLVDGHVIRVLATPRNDEQRRLFLDGLASFAPPILQADLSALKELS